MKNISALLVHYHDEFGKDAVSLETEAGKLYRYFPESAVDETWDYRKGLDELGKKHITHYFNGYMMVEVKSQGG